MGFDCPMPRFAGFIRAVETNFAVRIGPNKIGDGGLHRRRFAHIVEGRATMMSEHGNAEKQKETGAQPQSGKQLSIHVDSLSGRNLFFRVYSVILQACQAAAPKWRSSMTRLLAHKIHTVLRQLASSTFESPCPFNPGTNPAGADRLCAFSFA
jgi:hypothetical protein